MYDDLRGVRNSVSLLFFYYFFLSLGSIVKPVSGMLNSAWCYYGLSTSFRTLWTALQTKDTVLLVLHFFPTFSYSKSGPRRWNYWLQNRFRNVNVAPMYRVFCIQERVVFSSRFGSVFKGMVTRIRKNFFIWMRPSLFRTDSIFGLRKWSQLADEIDR